MHTETCQLFIQCTWNMQKLKKKGNNVNVIKGEFEWFR